MSISEQVKELRKIAEKWNPNVPINPVSITLNQVADTIEDLSEKMIVYKEQQKPKKCQVINMVRCCSECDSQIKVCYKFCPYCGQAIDWSK